MASYKQTFKESLREGVRDAFENRTGIIGDTLRARRMEVEQQKQTAEEVAKINLKTGALRGHNATLIRLETLFTQISQNVQLIAKAMNAQVVSEEETRKAIEIPKPEKKSTAKLNQQLKQIEDNKKEEEKGLGLFDDFWDRLRRRGGGRRPSPRRGGRGPRGGKTPPKAPPKAPAAKPPVTAGGAAKIARTVGGRVLGLVPGVGTAITVGTAVYTIYELAKDTSIKHKYYNELTGEYETAEEVVTTTQPTPVAKPPAPAAETSEQRLKRLGVTASTAGGRGGPPTPMPSMPAPAAAPTPAATSGTSASEPLVKKISPEEGKKALLSELDRQKIVDGEKRAAIMAQAYVETGGFRFLSENLGYTVSGLRKTFGRLQGVPDERLQAAVNEKAPGVGNLIYGGDPSSPSYKFGVKNLGNTKPGDGVRFRGRGFFQLTGRANYEKAGAATDPASLLDMGPAAKTAVDFANRFKGDFGNVEAFTRFVNGGQMHVRKRGEAFARFLQDPSVTTAGINVARASTDVSTTKSDIARQRTNVQVINNNTVIGTSSPQTMQSRGEIHQPVGA